MTGISARGATGVGVASLVAAGSGYVVLVVAANVLDQAQNADFLAFWGLLFFLFGTLGGLQSEVTRSVHVARTRTPTGDPPSGARILPLGLLVGGGLAAALVVTSGAWATVVLGPRPHAPVALVALAVLAFGGHSAIVGTLAGRGHWTAYSRVVGAEAFARLALVVAVALAGAGLVGLQAATATAAATWLAMSAAPRVRAVWGQRAETPAGPFLTASGQAMLGAASSAALVVGFPVLLRVSTQPEVFAVAAPLLLAVQLTRAPLLIPLNAYQGVAITHFVTHHDDGVRPLLRLAAMIGAVGVAGAAAAALVGPWLMETLLGEGYRVGPAALAGLTLTAALLALLTMTGAACLALDDHRGYAAGWLIATACSATVLLLPGTLTVRVIASLAVGPVVGTLVHAARIRGVSRSQR